MACIYTLNKHTFQTEMELNDFLLENLEFLNKYGDIVFSRTSKANFACNILEERGKITQEYQDKIKKRSTYTELDEEYEIVKPFIGVNNFLSGLRKADGHLLFPEFRSESYWANKKERWSKGEFDSSEIELLFGNEAPTPIIDNATFEDSRKMIEDKWKAQGKIGEVIHYVAKKFFTTSEKGEGFWTFTDDFLLKVIQSSIDKGHPDWKEFINDTTLPEALKYCRDLQSKIEVELGEGNLTYYPEYAVHATTSKMEEGSDQQTKVLGVIDLLVVDSKGNTHIFDYKTSPLPYSEFSAAKTLTFKYQLATYNRILKTYGINTANSGMYINPIQLLDFKMVNDKWTYSSIKPFEGFTSNLTETINNNDSLQDNLDEFLPAPTIRKSSTEKLLANTSKVMAQWFPTYSFGKKVTDDLIQTEIKEKVTYDEASGKYKYTMNNGGSFSADSEEDMYKKIKDYYDKQPEKRLKTTNTIKNNIIRAIRDNNPDEIKFENIKSTPEGGSPLWFQEQIKPYINQNWEVLDCEPAESLGVLLLRNKLTNQIDILKISTANLLYQHQFVKGREGLTGAFESDLSQATKTNSLIARSITGNIELIEAMLVLNNMPELFEQNAKVGNMRVINPMGNTGVSLSNKELLYNFTELAKHIPLEENNFAGKQRIRFATYADVVYNKFKEILVFGEEKQWSGRYEDWKIYANVNNAMDACVQDPAATIAELDRLRKSMEKSPAFKSVLSKVQRGTYSIANNPEIQVYNYIMMAIAELKNMNFRQQLEDHDRWLDKVRLHQKGLSGSYVDNPGNLNSETLNLITKSVTIAYQNVRSGMEAPKNKFKKLLQDLKDEVGFTELTENTVGNQTSLYKKMIRNDGGNLFFVDPNNPHNGLSTAEKAFLEGVLSEINERRFAGRTEGEKDELRADQNSQWYWMPLDRGDTKSMASVSGLMAALKEKLKQWSPKVLVQEAKAKVEGFLTEKLEKEWKAKAASGAIWEMTNNFTHWDTHLQDRLDIIEEKGQGYFENNLETLALKYAFADEVKTELDNVFPTIKAAMIHLNLQGLSQNVEFEKDIGWFNDYVTNKIFNKSLISDKYRAFSEMSNKLMSMVSKLTLGFSPIQGVYQMLDGLWKDISIAWRKPMGEQSFGFKEFSKAYLNILTEFRYGTAGQTVPELLNELYGINDMDMNTYTDRIKSDRSGIFNFVNSWMFKFASRPDFYNRMSIFNAQMMKDGTWEAHSVVNGQLKYDWKKDKRFLAYTSGNKSNPEYGKQEALYYATAKQLVLENTKNADGSLFQVGQPLPKAYTTQQSESYKSLSDMVYGYYSHEKKAMIHSVGLGALFMQFRTYWSGKKNQYLAPGGIKSMGSMQQYEENGTKYYHKLDENGNVTQEATTDDTGIPFMVWKGQWQEGILITLTKVMTDLWGGVKEGNVREGFKMISNDIWNNEDAGLRNAYRNNIKQIIYDLGMLSFLGLFLAGWLEELFKEHLKENEGRRPTFTQALLDTGAYIGIRSLRSSSDDLNFMGSIGGIATDWTPMSFKFIASMYDNWSKVVGGDRDFYDAMVNSSSATRHTRHLFDYIKTEQLGLED